MSLNNTPSSERIHIGIFGKRNAGKSSVINAITGQDLAIVSDIKGTTTDPVLKSMELLPLGPVVLIDTPGLDDEGKLGTLRIKKAYQMLNKTDIAVLVVDGSIGMTEEDDRILTRIKEKNIHGMICQIFIVPALFVVFQYLQEKVKPMEWEDIDNTDPRRRCRGQSSPSP